MTEEELQQIREHIATSKERLYRGPNYEPANAAILELWTDDAPALLAEVERLRSVAQEIDRIGYNLDHDASGANITASLYVMRCPFCQRVITGPDEIRSKDGHTVDCLITKARAILEK